MDKAQDVRLKQSNATGLSLSEEAEPKEIRNRLQQFYGEDILSQRVV